MLIVLQTFFSTKNQLKTHSKIQIVGGKDEKKKKVTTEVNSMHVESKKGRSLCREGLKFLLDTKCLLY